MERAVFLATCGDPSHKYDAQVVRGIKGIHGIKAASAVPDMKIGGKKYCIIARAEAKSKVDLRTVYREIDKQQHLETVKQLTAKQS